MKEIIAKGDASHPSIPDDTYERSGSKQSLQVECWHDWHIALLDRPDLHYLVGGEAIVREHRLMLVPPMSWNDVRNRAAAIGWPIHEGKPANVIRRFLDDKDPRYQGLGGRGHQLWPDLWAPYVRYLQRREVVLVCGMRDACWTRAAGLDAFTTTGGVQSWPNVEQWARTHRFTLCFDRGEEAYAEALADRLIANGAKSARVIEPPHPFKDLAALGEAKGAAAIHNHVQRSR